MKHNHIFRKAGPVSLQTVFGLLFLLIIITLLGPVQSYGQCEKIKWQDEFDSPNLDLSKWEYETGGGGWGTGQLDYATARPENVRIENGKLVLEIRKEEYNGSHYTSGRLRTYKKADFQYGRIEARVKGVYSQGNGFAFWLLGSDYESIWWPKCGEIDIFENTGKVPSKNIGTAHYEESYGHAFSQGSYTLANGARWADDFHTTAIEWSPTYVKWYMDGNLYHTLDLTQPINGYRPFNRPFFIIMSVGMGGSYSGDPDATTVNPMKAEIEYVRVYEGKYSTYVSGPATIYQGDQAKEYSVNVAPAGYTFNWTVPTGATITSGQGTNKIIVNWSATTPGGDLKVAVTSGTCGTNTYTLPVKSQAPFVTDKMHDDFETATPAFTYAAMSGTLTRQVANPATNFVNNTPKVGRYIRNAAQQYDYITVQNVKAQPIGEFIYGKRKVLIDVYSNAPIGTKVSMNFENSKVATGANYPSGRYAIFDAVTTKQNQWETLEFNYTSSPDIYGSAAEVDQWILLFAPVTSLGTTFYIDNIRTGQSGGTPPTVYTDVLQNNEGTDQLTKDFSNGVYSVVNNPASAAPNTSTKVAKYVRDAGSSYDALVFKTLSIADAYGYKNNTKKILMDVYTDAPVGTRLSLNFEISSTSLPDNWPAGRHSNYEAITTKQNQWETVAFTISSTPDKGASDGAVDKMVFLFNPVTNTTNTYYIDNIRVASTTPRETLVLANTWEDYDANHNLSSIASVTGTYTPSIANPFPANGNTTKVAKYVRSSAQQWDLLIFNKGAAVVNGKALKERTQKIALDVYTDAPAGTPITIGIDASSIATADNYPTGRHSNYQGITRVQNGWQTIYLSFAAAPDPGTPDNLIDHISVLFDPGHLTGHTYYIDNVRTMNVVVDQQPLASIAVSPATSTVNVGQTVQFTAQGKDSNGNNVNITPTWSVTGGGSISAGGLFTASTVGGPFTVKATSGAISGQSTVTVTAAATNIALNKPSFASTGTASLGNDGNMNTRWESASADPQWMYIDLQAVYNISKVILKWETASGKNYNIQVSNDAITWGNAFTTTTGDGATDDIPVIVSGRYVRMYGTVRNTGWGYSLWEFEVYGTPATVPILTDVVVTPASVTLNVGATQQFTAQGKDQFGNNFTFTPTWYTTGGGSITTNGLFTATTTGTFQINASGNGGAIVGYTPITINNPNNNTNIALNKPATASSGTGINLVNDGNINTRWESNWGANAEYITIDLGASYSISRVVLKWEPAYAKTYIIQTSPDNNVSWSDIYTTTTGDGGTDDITVTGTGRYIRVYNTVRATAYGYSLWEFEVYGTTSSTPVLTTIAVTPATTTLNVGGTQQYTAQGKDQFGANFYTTFTWSTTGGGTITSGGLFTATTAGGPFSVKATSGAVSGTASVTVNNNSSVNLALNKPIVASTTEYATPSAANDGNAGTRWGSNFTNAEWIYVDLQAKYNLNRVLLNWEAAYGKTYDIQVSDNTTTWTTIFTTTTGDGGTDNITLSGAGRYVRMNGRLRATGYGFSLWEFEVYGTLAGARLALHEEKTIESSISLYPNPTDRILNVSGIVSFPATVTLYSVTSAVIQKTFNEGDDLTLDMSTLPTGVYLIRLKTKDSDHTQKVIKK